MLKALLGPDSGSIALEANALTITTQDDIYIGTHINICSMTGDTSGVGTAYTSGT